MKKLLSLLFAAGICLTGSAQIIINEVLYDPSNNGLDGDANGDGVYSQQNDEFIEFVNTGIYDFDMSGYQIWDDTISGSLRYTFPANTLVPPGGALVVFGGGNPVGQFGGAVVLSASVSPLGLSLNNSGEIIAIKNPMGQTVLTFNSDALSDNPNESYTRNPDISGAFEQHSTNTPLYFSPGTRLDGTPFDTTFVSPPPPVVILTPLIINEVLYDPSNNALDGDANGDGVYEQEEDSFIEFINTDSVNYNAGGYQIWDDTINGQLRYTIPANTIIPPGGALVVFGGGNPTGSFGGAIVLTADTGVVGLSLTNSGEVIVIKNSQGKTVLTFDSDILSNNPNESYTRNPDLTGNFEQHGTNTSVLFSPGTMVNGTAFNTTFNPPIAICNPAFTTSASATGNYRVQFSWASQSVSSYVIRYRLQGDTAWLSTSSSTTSKLLQNRMPGTYEYYISAGNTGNFSCTQTFTIVCESPTYSYNVFQATELDALPANSARVNVFNISGGKSLYDVELVYPNSSSSLLTNRRNAGFNQLTAGNYSIRVYDDFNCQSDSVGAFTIAGLDTAYIPNLISAVNQSPNGFKPLWNRPRSNGSLMPGVINYQVRIRNVTDNVLVNTVTGITDTSLAVTGLTPGKLYRFNVRSRYDAGSGARNSAWSNRRDRNLGAGGNKTDEAPDAMLNSLNVYPNPSSAYINIEASEGSRLQLRDIQGRILQSATATAGISQLDLTAYAPGTYIVEVETGESIQRIKVVKQ